MFVHLRQNLIEDHARGWREFVKFWFVSCCSCCCVKWMSHSRSKKPKTKCRWDDRLTTVKVKVIFMDGQQPSINWDRWGQSHMKNWVGRIRTRKNRAGSAKLRPLSPTHDWVTTNGFEVGNICHGKMPQKVRVPSEYPREKKKKDRRQHTRKIGNTFASSTA